jgi:hypothetical protein
MSRRTLISANVAGIDLSNVRGEWANRAVLIARKVKIIVSIIIVSEHLLISIW